jgi:hypothetical protein
LTCFCLFSDARVAVSDPADCAYPAHDDINANENADAPKTKAREYLTPKAILPQPVVLSRGCGWRAPIKKRLLAGYQFSRSAPRHVSRHLGYAALQNRSIMPGRTLYRL